MNYCANCANPIEVRGNKKYCSKGCKQRAYRKRKGIKEPSFLTSSPSTIPSTVSNIQPLQTKAIGRSAIAKPIISPMSVSNGLNVNPIWIVLGGAILGGNITRKRGEPFSIEGAIIGGTITYGINYLISQNTPSATILNKPTKKTIPLPMESNKTSSIVSGSDYKSKFIDQLEFTDKWMYLIGKPQKNFFALVHGMPGNGKTTFASDLANYFDHNFGKVLYLAAEQKGYSSAFQRTMKQSDSNYSVHVDAHKLKLEDILELKGYDMLVFDSVNFMGLEASDMELIRDTLGVAVVAIMQSTKEGQFRGSNDWAHNADVIIEAKNMIAHQTKSRYAAPSKIEI